VAAEDTDTPGLPVGRAELADWERRDARQHEREPKEARRARVMSAVCGLTRRR
jgi:hypothetical protein